MNIDVSGQLFTSSPIAYNGEINAECARRNIRSKPAELVGANDVQSAAKVIVLPRRRLN
jgi:hypothetical protein